MFYRKIYHNLDRSGNVMYSSLVVGLRFAHTPQTTAQEQKYRLKKLPLYNAKTAQSIRLNGVGIRRFLRFKDVRPPQIKRSWEFFGYLTKMSLSYPKLSCSYSTRGVPMSFLKNMMAFLYLNELSDISFPRLTSLNSPNY